MPIYQRQAREIARLVGRGAYGAAIRVATAGGFVVGPLTVRAAVPAVEEQAVEHGQPAPATAGEDD